MASIKKYPAKKGPRGYLWRVQYRDPAGRSRTKSGFLTRDEAQAWADQNATSVRQQDWIDPTAGNVTVSEVGERWQASQAHLKPSTAELTRTLWQGTVKPRWGTYRLSNVQHSEIQAWVAELALDYSPSWTRHCAGVLSQILSTAVRDGRIRDNPAKGLKYPRRSKGVKVYWTIEQLKLFAHECGAREDLILLLGTSGLRWGEAIALRPRDLDQEKSRIRVTRNAAKVGNGIVLGTPKTHEKRSVAVPRQVMEMLAIRSKKMGSNDLLWTGARGGWLRAPGHNTWFDGAMRRSIDKDPTMERVSPHGLRHVAAGLLVHSGANVKAVQRQLGHASATMTLDTYAELFDDGLDEVAQALDDLLAERECRENVVDSAE